MKEVQGAVINIGCDVIIQRVCCDAQCLQHPRPKLIIGPFNTSGVYFTMPSTVTAPSGAQGSARLVPQPDGAAFVGVPKIESSNESVVQVQDNGDGTATLIVVGSEGQSCSIVGTDTGNNFSDFCTFTVGPNAGPPAETGVALEVTF